MTDYLKVQRDPIRSAFAEALGEALGRACDDPACGHDSSACSGFLYLVVPRPEQVW